MKLIAILIFLILMSCENKTQPEKLIQHFSKAKSENLFLNSKGKKIFCKKPNEIQKTDLQKLKLNGKVFSTSQIYFDVYPVGDTYYKVNTFGVGWDPNDIISTYFNEYGFVTKTIVELARNKDITKRIFSYDDENKLISKNKFEPDGFTGICNENYFAQPNDPFFSKDTTISFFNSGGFLKEKRIVDRNTGKIKSAINFVYDFDEKGNWIKCILYQKDIPIGINERTIEYYK